MYLNAGQINNNNSNNKKENKSNDNCNDCLKINATESIGRCFCLPALQIAVKPPLIWLYRPTPTLQYDIVPWFTSFRWSNRLDFKPKIIDHSMHNNHINKIIQLSIHCGATLFTKISGLSLTSVLAELEFCVSIVRHYLSAVRTFRLSAYYYISEKRCRNSVYYGVCCKTVMNLSKRENRNLIWRECVTRRCSNVKLNCTRATSQTNTFKSKTEIQQPTHVHRSKQQHSLVIWDSSSNFDLVQLHANVSKFNLLYSSREFIWIFTNCLHFIGIQVEWLSFL